MDYDVREVAGVSVVRITGELRAGDASLIDVVQPHIDRPSARVVLDLSGVAYVSSAGLGELVRLAAQANSQRAGFTLAALSPFVAGVLETTQLNRFFDTAPDVESAIRKLTTPR